MSSSANRTSLNPSARQPGTRRLCFDSPLIGCECQKHSPPNYGNTCHHPKLAFYALEKSECKCVYTFDLPSNSFNAMFWAPEGQYFVQPLAVLLVTQ
eukprot:520430-Amphidinium_carterae.1